MPFSRGALYWLLSNPIYIGKLRHKENLRDGQHDGIIPLDLWDAVQADAALLPEDKLLIIRLLALEGSVMMVGDGVHMRLGSTTVTTGGTC